MPFREIVARYEPIPCYKMLIDCLSREPAAGREQGVAMNVLFISPGFPFEMPLFARGLAREGATVLGVGDQPESQIPAAARGALSAYLRVPMLWDEDAVVRAVKNWRLPVKIDRIACLWEPGMYLAARLRRELGLPGMTYEETVPFRDKERMKTILDEAGVRTPRHRKATTDQEVREAAKDVGFPLIIKPIAGAGSADTYKVRDQAHLDEIMPRIRHVPEVSVEEFVQGEEYTFDTICADGRLLYYNIAHYRPNVLTARSEEWISPQTVTRRDVETPEMKRGEKLGRAVLKALGFKTGFTHMEWFLTPKGEAVFGEIAARPPGGRSTELMNYGCDIDVFRGWAEAELTGKLTQKVERKFNAAVTFKRAQGQGYIRKIQGLDELVQDFGQHITCIDLLPVGAHRRNWKQTLVSDGYVIVRHPDLAYTEEMADRIGRELQLYASP